MVTTVSSARSGDVLRRIDVVPEADHLAGRVECPEMHFFVAIPDAGRDRGVNHDFCSDLRFAVKLTVDASVPSGWWK